MGDQLTISGLVATQPAVDGLGADFKKPEAFEDAADLLGAEFAADEAEDLSALRVCVVRATTAAPSPSYGVAVGLLGAVLLSVGGQVTRKLATDGAGVPANLASDLRLRVLCHSQSIDGVSFLLGELVIRFHRCNLVLGRIRCS